MLSTLGKYGTISVKRFDEEHLWISDGYGERLFNVESLQVDFDYGNLMSHEYGTIASPYKYNNRILVVNNNAQGANICLYDISNYEVPVLLDEKNEDRVLTYFFIDNYIIEAFGYGPVNVYSRFYISFSEVIQELDFNTFIENLVCDEENHRIASSSNYFLKTFSYENNGNGLNIIPNTIPEINCYPNPFNPETTISFNIDESSDITELTIYNLKGQKIRMLINETLSVGEHQIV